MGLLLFRVEGGVEGDDPSEQYRYIGAGDRRGGDGAGEPMNV